MSKLRMVLAGGILNLALSVAGPSGYLPEAGPTPLRFAPDPKTLPTPKFPPLLMKTPHPVDPGAATNEVQFAGQDDLGLAARGDAQNPWLGRSTEIYGAADLPPAVNPYADGQRPIHEEGWVRILLTNNHGLLSLPVPAVDFLPPAPSAPQSRATYRVVR